MGPSWLLLGLLLDLELNLFLREDISRCLRRYCGNLAGFVYAQPFLALDAEFIWMIHLGTLSVATMIWEDTNILKVKYVAQAPHLLITTNHPRHPPIPTLRNPQAERTPYRPCRSVPPAK